ncbi:MAG: CopG family transcriptional regulator [Candidatus Raymondbacteria bacterium RifOxyC12_full_50_8]|uniref:CopG family transcriptional regulator n=1 Tax=Candidatus Raymondbacteria bacterium RIFOXYD12_FULL_49_13 TaxID=1817890 RepID=A0A1F7FI18_UNCRA|nr:MAG: CopG family transcriptional regulator [Candidatus Raymondbacteria bacterium RIFOXYA2_FULL_49_16]OGJ99529.1 MAG: CopG family transcriptional regulator [Candidatus Raymondbacteria bacterium RifOxyB12_full_50_8]OGK06258.1 MAG: CopG family transcriptional regulator [Candidatus Raymondbacteria bacterium RIFOXYD12_FULL_49_13]OGK07714.1 MAG: CopG family transcriptional regulator [Candidatus Raymondbacteria bacterium RifOxyC12_full_50_8]OGP40590.1 MAG: CopG family transcriptional regulator [Can
MAAYTVNISFGNTLIRQIDSVAKEESRSRSELIREAARLYIDRKTRWKTIFKYGSAAGRASGVTESDIITEIRRVRTSGK